MVTGLIFGVDKATYYTNTFAIFQAFVSFFGAAGRQWNSTARRHTHR
jgi:hypothetical protein